MSGHNHKLYLSETDKKIAGVCGGIGEAFGIDSTLIRLGVVFLALVTAIFPVVITYFIAWIIIPQAPHHRVKAHDIEVDPDELPETKVEF